MTNVAVSPERSSGQANAPVMPTRRSLSNTPNIWLVGPLTSDHQGSVRIFVFGAPYTTGLGVHDIHMNQGDPPGPFQHLDGIWQDGGVLIERPDGEIMAFLVKFATQSLHTNSQGLPI